MKKIFSHVFFQISAVLLLTTIASAQMINYEMIEKRKQQKIQLINQPKQIQQEAQIINQTPAPAPKTTYRSYTKPRATKTTVQPKRTVKKVQAERVKAAVKKQTTSSDTFDQIVKSSPKVKDRIERIYDLNNDGTLQQKEIVDMYKDVVLSVNRRGSFLVSSDLLKSFDQNKDGQISRAEASVLQATINP